MIIRGDKYGVNVNSDVAQDLLRQGYKWSGHTHPGTGFNTCIASEGDLFVLASFNQDRSVIYDSSGKFNVFGGD